MLGARITPLPSLKTPVFLNVRPILPFPYVQRFGLFELLSRHPFVMVLSVSDPSYQVLPPSSSSPRVNDLIYEILLGPFGGDDWGWSGEFPVWEQLGVVRDEPLE